MFRIRVVSHFRAWLDGIKAQIFGDIHSHRFGSATAAVVKFFIFMNSSVHFELSFAEKLFAAFDAYVILATRVLSNVCYKTHF